MLLLLLAAVITSTSAQTVVISDTSAVLGTGHHTFTCILMGSSATGLQYQWRVGESIMQPFTSDNRFFIPIGVSAARSDYSCDVKLTGTGAVYNGTASLTLTLPDFTVTFARDRDSPTDQVILHVGSNISYSCQTLLPGPEDLFEGLAVTMKITGPSGTLLGSTGDRVRVSETTQDGNSFTRTLYFSPLSAEDMGEYKCASTLQSATPNPLVTSRTKSSTSTVSIIALELSVKLAPVNESLSVSEPLSLSCSATVMIRNDPAPFNIEFSWLLSANSGPREELTSDLYTNSRVFGSAETSNLTVRTEKPGNHTYTCRVNLDVRPAPDVIMDEDSVTLKVVGLSNMYVVWKPLIGVLCGIIIIITITLVLWKLITWCKEEVSLLPTSSGGTSSPSSIEITIESVPVSNDGEEEDSWNDPLFAP